MPSTLVVDNIQPRTGTTVTMPAGSKFYAPGSIVQVQSTTLTSTFSSSSTSWVDVTNMLVNITPVYNTSKIFCTFNCYASGSATSGVYGVGVRLLRNLNVICIGDARGSTTQASAYIGTPYASYGQSLNFSYMDSPASSSLLTYKIQMIFENASYAGILGGSSATGASYTSSTPITLTLMEIAQ